MTAKYPPIREDRDDLLNIAHPTIYLSNPFRLLQVPVKASAKTISTQLNKFDMVEKLGDFNNYEEFILPLNPFPDVDTRRQAAHRLENPEFRLVDELFWFWPRDGAWDNDTALIELKHGRLTEAATIWRENINDKDNGYISLHNIAILYHILCLDFENNYGNKPVAKQKKEYWNIAFRSWLKVISKDELWNFLAMRVKEFDDPRLTTATLQNIRDYLPQILLSINAELALRAAQKQDYAEAKFHISLMRSVDPDTDLRYNSDIILDVLARIVKPLYQQIQLNCDDARLRTTEAPELGKGAAIQIIEQTNPLLLSIDAMLPPDHPLYETAHDEIALFVMRSIVGYANKTADYLPVVQALKQAETTAVSESVRQQITERLTYFRDNAMCWFCKQNVADVEAVYELPMYGNVQTVEPQTTFPTTLAELQLDAPRGAQIRWQQLKVKVPRCNRCLSAHEICDSLDWVVKLGGVSFCTAIVIIFILWIILIS